MVMWSVDWVCRTLLVLTLAVLDGRCFVVVREAGPAGGNSSPARAATAAAAASASSASSSPRNPHQERRHQPWGEAGGRSLGVTCEYNGKVYPPGEYQISPCVSCVCERSGELRCTSETCEPEPGCIEYDRVPGQCCAQCLRHGCMHNGTGFPRGARIPTGPCTKCYCPWQGGGTAAKAVCMDFHCPPVKCVDATVPRGHCCPFCPNGENCWLEDLVIPAGQDVWVDKCRSCYCPEGAEADGAVTSSANAVSSRKPKLTSSDGRRRQGYARKALCYRHSGCIEW